MQELKLKIKFIHHMMQEKSKKIPFSNGDKSQRQTNAGFFSLSQNQKKGNINKELLMKRWTREC